MSKWTPDFGEPWHRATKEECGYFQSAILVQADGSSVGEMTSGFPDQNARINNSYRADRVAACVNAMAGIDDPAAYIENSHEAFRQAARLDAVTAERDALREQVARAKRIEEAARDLIGSWQDDTSPLTNPIERLMTALETNP
jgi:hypothetical protein